MSETTTQTIFEFAKIDEPSTWILVGAAMLLLVVAVRLIYRWDSVEMPRVLGWLNTLLRVGVLVLLCWVFLEPVQRTEEKLVRRARTLLLFDVSQSMSIRDRDDGEGAAAAQTPSRFEILVKNLEQDNQQFLTALQARNDVFAYRFGRSLESVVTLARREEGKPPDAQQRAAAPPDWKRTLEPEADQTRLGEALSNLFRRESSAPVAAVVVFTDGQVNAGVSIEGAVETAVKRAVPVYAVPFGNTKQPHNLRVVRLQAPTHTYPDDSFSLTAYVHGVGYPGRSFNVELIRKAGAEEAAAESIETREVALSDGDEPVAVTFTQSIKTPGRFLYTVRIAPQPGELIEDDNEQSAWVNVVDRKAKVLLLASGPTREYMFARLVLNRDKTIELSILLQNMDQGGSQESREILTEFPSREKLFEFDAVIAFDPDYTLLKEDHLEALNEWVFKEGGGFVAVAGIHHTPRLASRAELTKARELYPVVFGSDLELVEMADREAAEAWPLEFTEEGKSSEATRLSDEPELSQKAWSVFKGVNRCFPVKQEKPGAIVLARFTDPRAQTDSGKAVFMAEQFFGSGRCLYLGAGEFWRVRRMDVNFYTRLWVGIVRYVTQGRLLRGSQKGFLMVDKDTYAVGSTVRARARLRDSQLKPLLTPQVPMNVISPDGEIAEVALLAEENRPGWFAGEWRVRRTGIHRMELVVPGTKDKVEKSIAAVAPNLEFEDPRRNDLVLDELTRKTGGKRFAIDELSKLAEAIPERSEEEIVSGVPVTLWDRRWVMFLAAALLTVEWLVRKLNNLA
jgi:hypothetical protein